MAKIFLDTNVILDILGERDPFYNDSALVLSKLDNSEHQGYISSIIVTTIYYVLKKIRSDNFARAKLKKLLLLVKVLAVDEKIINESLNLKFKDFEDAVQYSVAKNNKIDFIITRNKKDFKVKDISILEPKEFLMALGNL